MKLSLNVTDATHGSSINSIAWNINGTHFITLDDSGTIKKFNEKGQIQEDFVIQSQKHHQNGKNNEKDNDEMCFVFVAPYLASASHPHSSNGVQVSNTSYLLADGNGKIYFVTEKGRIDRVIDAHSSPSNIISLKWSPDRMAFFTLADDGALKVWSASGMLRSVLVQSTFPIFDATWSPQSDAIVYTQGKNLVLKPLSPSQKSIEWKAHDGMVTHLDWNHENTSLILSGGEEGKYKVWDAFGRLQFSVSKAPHALPIRSVSWIPTSSNLGFLVAVGDKLILCDTVGWSHGSVDLKGGLIRTLSFTEDGRQVAVGMSVGSIYLGQIVERTIYTNDYSFCLKDSTHIGVNQVNQLDEQVLDYKDSIVHFQMDYGHLIVLTTRQIYIHPIQHLTTPHIIPLPNQKSSVDASNAASLVTRMLLSATYFALLDKNNQVYIYTLEGKQVSTFSVVGLRTTGTQSISLTTEYFVIVDPNERNSIQMIDIQSGKWMLGSKWKHQCDIVSIATFNGRSINRYANMTVLAFIDQQKDLWLYDFYRKESKKLRSMVDHVRWNQTNTSLSAIAEGRWICWFYPVSIFIDEELTSLASVMSEERTFGSSSRIQTFSGSLPCQIRKSDGTILHVGGDNSRGNGCTLVLLDVLHTCFEKRDWEKAIRLCRYAKRQDLWACLAAMSIQFEDLNTAEVAYAALEMTPKVQNINRIKEIENPDWRKAELLLFQGRYQESEQLLLSKNLIYRAIFMWIEMFEWGNALEICKKHRSYLDIVCFFRAQFLKQMNIEKETDERFLQLQSVYDPDFVRDKIMEEENRGR